MVNRMASCVVMAAAVVGSCVSSRHAAAKDAVAKVKQPIVKVVDIFVNSVNVEQGKLVADATVTLDIAGRTVERAVDIPLSLDGMQGAAGQCDILNLAVGPLDLDLLGLVVELDDCNDGPVMVDITAVAGSGLLGDLLCDIAGLLDGGLDLGGVLSGLTSSETGLLTDALASVLNGVFDQLLSSGVAAQHNQSAAASTKGGKAKGKSHRCDILNLELAPIHLNLLGLQVDTSDICLDVYAEQGKGNLLGNLLCGLVKLLDTKSSTAAQLAKVAEIGRLLNRLGL